LNLFLLPYSYFSLLDNSFPFVFSLFLTFVVQLQFYSTALAAPINNILNCVFILLTFCRIYIQSLNSLPSNFSKMRFIDIVFSSLSLVAAVRGLSTSASQVTVHVVQVGPDGQLSFSPENIQANPGDMVQYQFHPKVCVLFAFPPSCSSASQCNSFRRGPANHPSHRTTQSSNQRSAVLVYPSTM
jgi:hypothetical protein